MFRSTFFMLFLLPMVALADDHQIQYGLATYYTDACDPEYHGITSSGEKFDETEMTAAHRTLPFGTIVDVLNPANKKSVRVRITDRGPNEEKHLRIIDLSINAFSQISEIRLGKIPVEVHVIWMPKTARPKSRAKSIGDIVAEVKNAPIISGSTRLGDDYRKIVLLCMSILGKPRPDGITADSTVVDLIKALK